MNAQPHLRGLFISTHALTEGDMKEVNIELWKMISTHALTEGDGLDVVEEYNFEISTHALTEGDALRSS